MVIGSFISSESDARYTLEKRDETWCICINGSTDSYSDNESHMRQKFEDLKRLLSK
jgi:hypothetical protein